METVTFVWNALKVALGLGFVIFIHELGHFLLAKWNGVKVEKFSVGFGPTLASFRRGVGLRIGTGSRPPGPSDPPSYGETEYILAALPLGGFVKMLGESTEEQPKDVEKSTDPRAFHNKSVGGRMAIITAGVIMNLILGFVCFSFVHTQPGIDIEAKVGGVLPGSPASLAGLRAGDEMVAVDGQRDLAFSQVKAKINLSGENQVIHLLVKRAGLDGEKAIDIIPVRIPGSPMPTIGFYQASSLNLAGNPPFAPLPGQDGDGDKDRKSGGFQVNDKIVAVGPEGGAIEPVADYFDLIRKLDQHRAERVVVEVERTDPKLEGASSSAPKRIKLGIPPHKFLDFGFRLTPGPIASVQPDSPASKAGFEKGDRIIAVEDQADFDPMRLPDIVRDHAGTPMTFKVKRSKGGDGPDATIAVTPDSTPPWTDLSIPSNRVDPLNIPGLGLSILVEPKIVAVAPGSPAARSGLKVGDSLRSIVITPEKTDRLSGKALTFASDENKAVAWPTAFAFLQENPVKAVRFLVNDSDQPIEARAEVVADRFHPLRGLNFQAATRPIPPASFSEAVRLGASETWENVTGIYKIFRNLAQKRVGGDAFGGMIPIAQVAYNSASAGFTPFMQFLGFLSVNLAVLNFLPIPPLDGGQFLFLTAEKVRGKPLPDAYLAAGTIAGIAFVLILIVVINVKDVVQLVQSYF